MYTDDDLEQVLRDLASDVPRERVLTLQVLVYEPTGTERLLPRLRELLDDRTPALLGLPYLYGEVRWIAAHTLAKEYRACGIGERVVVADIPYPLGVNALGALAEAHHIVTRGGHEGCLAAFAELRARGLLEVTTLSL
ncbi:hypothetical protein [Actinomadura rugatobispora]|uniref:Uncharacterized protein n=1 Tax=Actinomadura rugatobispora TaxID=1994 RepID=A0ABW0ZZX1_9ACTN